MEYLAETEHFRNFLNLLLKQSSGRVYTVGHYLKMCLNFMSLVLLKSFSLSFQSQDDIHVIHNNQLGKCYYQYHSRRKNKKVRQ